jgi:hypothetical protein
MGVALYARLKCGEEKQRGEICIVCPSFSVNVICLKITGL